MFAQLYTFIKHKKATARRATNDERYEENSCNLAQRIANKKLIGFKRYWTKSIE